MASGNQGGGLLCLPGREEPRGMKEVIFYWTKRSLSMKPFWFYVITDFCKLNSGAG
jgi:hypothetical protein